jgi:hypothetical protein
MYSQAKAIALLRDLGNKLQIRFANGGTGSINTLSQGFTTTPDAAGAVWPYILLYNATAGTGTGNPVIYIEIAGVDAVSKDIFGNDTDSYAPHKMLFGYELGAAGNETWAAHSDIVTAEFEAIKTGVAFTLVEVANGAGVTAATVSAATPVTTIDELYWPTKLV